MVTVIESNVKELRTTCKTCGSELEYLLGDVRFHFFNISLCNYHEIKCPACGSLTDVTDQVEDENYKIKKG